MPMEEVMAEPALVQLSLSKSRRTLKASDELRAYAEASPCADPSVTPTFSRTRVSRGR